MVDMEVVKVVVVVVVEADMDLVESMEEDMEVVVDMVGEVVMV